MVPVAGVVQAIKSQIQGVMPQVSFELGMISETLSSIVIEVGEAMNSDYDISPSSSEAQKTLAEANSMAQQRMSERVSLRYPWQRSRLQRRHRSIPKSNGLWVHETSHVVQGVGAYSVQVLSWRERLDRRVSLYSLQARSSLLCLPLIPLRTDRS